MNTFGKGCSVAIALALAACTMAEPVKESSQTVVTGLAKPPLVAIDVVDDQPVSSPTDLGNGLEDFVTMLILPIVVTKHDYVGDATRAQFVARALQAQLSEIGIVAEPSSDARVNAPYVLSAHIKQLSVDSRLGFMLPLVIANAAGFYDRHAVATLDCTLADRNGAPVWHGAVSGEAQDGDVNVAGSSAKVVQMALRQATEALVKQANFLERSSDYARGAFPVLMKAAASDEAGRHLSEAMSEYENAYRIAADERELRTVGEAMGRTLREGWNDPDRWEDVRKHQIQANAAVASKNFALAADLYGHAVAENPWWDAGHYNRALILATLKNYRAAVAEMEFYLALSPQAANARAATDKVYEWQGMLSQAAN